MTPAERPAAGRLAGCRRRAARPARLGAGRRRGLATVVPLLVATAATMALSVAERAHCIQKGWTGSDQFWHACFSDLPVALPARQPRRGARPPTSAATAPASDHPVLTGAVMAWVGGLVPDGDVPRPDPLVLRAVGPARHRPARWPSSGSPPRRARCTPPTPPTSRSARCCSSPRWCRPTCSGWRWPAPASGPGAGAARRWPGCCSGLGGHRPHLPAAHPAGPRAARAAHRPARRGAVARSVAAAGAVARGPAAVPRGQPVGDPAALPGVVGQPGRAGLAVDAPAARRAPAADRGHHAAGRRRAWSSPLVRRGGLRAEHAAAARRLAEVALVLVALALLTGKALPGAGLAVAACPWSRCAACAGATTCVWAGAEALHFVAVWLYVGGLSKPDRGLPPGWYAVFLVLRARRRRLPRLAGLARRRGGPRADVAASPELRRPPDEPSELGPTAGATDAVVDELGRRLHRRPRPAPRPPRLTLSRAGAGLWTTIRRCPSRPGTLCQVPPRHTSTVCPGGSHCNPPVTERP